MSTTVIGVILFCIAYVLFFIVMVSENIGTVTLLTLTIVMICIMWTRYREIKMSNLEKK